MPFISKHFNLKRSLCGLLLVILIFVFSGLGVLAVPKSTKATLPTFDIPEKVNKVIIAVWKMAVFPLVKRIMINIATRGDFGVTWDDIKTWLWKDLAFQTLESVLNTYGYTLCSRFSANIRIALAQSVAPPGVRPWCTFDQSWAAQTVKEALTEGTDVAWAKARRDFFKNISLTARGSNNMYGKWFETRDTFHSKLARLEGDYQVELLMNNGFFGSRDCSKWKPKGRYDLNRDGIKQPEECPVRTPGQTISHLIAKRYSNLEEGSIRSVVMTDLLAVFAQILDTWLNDAVRGITSKINEWKTDQEREAAIEYQEKTSKQRVGENRLIPIPEE